MLQIFWNFAFADSFEASTCMHVTSTWKQYLISLCFTSVSHCSLNFECLRLGYGFLSIILVLEKCNLGPWKSLKSAWILYFEFATNPVKFNFLHCCLNSYILYGYQRTCIKDEVSLTLGVHWLLRKDKTVSDIHCLRPVRWRAIDTKSMKHMSIN